ncbi:MAG: hypothetical protein Q8906_06015 [Bacillota bacterium]|nr:hypothetical protein [Bacillota bacterium]
MPTLDEVANQETVQANEMPTIEPLEMETQQEPSRINEILNKILTAETGAGSVEDYLDHPMNFLKSRGLAKILRGFTGIFGSLSLAVIDIALGTLEFSKERKQGAVTNDVSGGGGFSS